jgi:hypothetical protein
MTHSENHHTPERAGQSSPDRSRPFRPISGQARSGPRVIDLASGPERGGLDPEVPAILLPLQITGRLVVGHTADLSDPAEPILVDPGEVVFPGTPAADLRCAGCISKPTIGRLGGDTWAMIQHERGCQRLDELAQRASQR